MSALNLSWLPDDADEEERIPRLSWDELGIPVERISVAEFRLRPRTEQNGVLHDIAHLLHDDDVLFIQVTS